MMLSTPLSTHTARSRPDLKNRAERGVNGPTSDAKVAAFHGRVLALTISAEGGETWTLTMDLVKELFSYPVSDGHPQRLNSMAQVIRKVKVLPA
jgi:hypothetical protein